MSSEHITGVAIKDKDGEVHFMSKPARHHHVIWWMRGRINQLIGATKTWDYEPAEQGFITNTGRYVNREEALEIATNANQLIKEVRLSMLFSEDLW